MDRTHLIGEINLYCVKALMFRGCLSQPLADPDKYSHCGLMVWQGRVSNTSAFFSFKFLTKLQNPGRQLCLAY